MGERAVNELKAEMTRRVNAVTKAVEEADKALILLEQKVQPLTCRAIKTPAPKMISLCDASDAVLKDARSSVVEAHKLVDKLFSGFDESVVKDLQAMSRPEVKPLQIRLGRNDGRITRAFNLSRRFRKHAGRKELTDLQRISTIVVRALRRNQQLKELSTDQVWSSFDSA